MGTALYIIIGVVIAFVGLIMYNYKKMNNMPAAADHENIRILNNKNFKTQIKSGVVMVDFWAPWCGPCKMVAPTLNSIAETESDKVKVAKVNVDKEQQIAQKFKIRNIPTMIIFKDGKEAKRIIGVKNKKFLMKEVELLLN